jgi:hypothetical protein
MPNAHLNPAYFAGEAVPAFAQPAGRTQTDTSGGSAVNLADTIRMAVPAALRGPAKGSRSRRIKTALLAALLIVILVGALAPLRSSKDAMASSDLIPLAEQGIAEAPAPVMTSPFEPPEEIAKPSPPPPVAKAQAGGPNAIVTVPGVGLRHDHSITSKIITGTSLRKGERVAVLKRFAGGSGPSWVQVRTKTGRTGWVFASLVHVKR